MEKPHLHLSLGGYSITGETRDLRPPSAGWMPVAGVQGLELVLGLEPGLARGLAQVPEQELGLEWGLAQVPEQELGLEWGLAQAPEKGLESGLVLVQTAAPDWKAEK